MFKRIVTSSLALAALMVGPSQPAFAQPGCQNIYLTHMWSDETHTVQVGFISGVCSYPYIQYTLFGTYTYFQTEEVDGNCGCGPIE